MDDGIWKHLRALRRAMAVGARRRLAPSLRSGTVAAAARQYRLRVYGGGGGGGDGSEGPSLEQLVVLAQANASQHPDFAHEQVVEECAPDLLDSNDIVPLFRLGTPVSGGAAEAPPPDVVEWPSPLRLPLPTGSCAPHPMVPVVRRHRERVRVITVPILGDRAAGKTTLLAALSSADMRILQVLRYHTNSFLNLWLNPSAEDVARFVAEVSDDTIGDDTERCCTSAAGATGPHKGGNATRREYPFFPSQLCYATLTLESSELQYFLEDDELCRANDIPPTLDTAVSEESGGAHDSCGPSSEAPLPQTCVIKLLEVGGDLLDEMMLAPAHSRNNTTDAAACAAAFNHSIVTEHLRAAAAAPTASIAFFLHAHDSLASRDGVDALLRRLAFVLATATAPLSEGGGAPQSVRLHLFLTHLEKLAVALACGGAGDVSNFSAALTNHIAALFPAACGAEQEAIDDAKNGDAPGERGICALVARGVERTLRSRVESFIAVEVSCTTSPHVAPGGGRCKGDTPRPSHVDFEAALRVLHQLLRSALCRGPCASQCAVVEQRSAGALRGEPPAATTDPTLVDLAARLLLRRARARGVRVITTRVAAELLFGLDASDVGATCCGSRSHQPESSVSSSDEADEGGHDDTCRISVIPLNRLREKLDVLPPLLVMDLLPEIVRRVVEDWHGGRFVIAAPGRSAQGEWVVGVALAPGPFEVQERVCDVLRRNIHT